MDAIDFLKANQSETPSRFREQAQYFKDNWSWLKYSYAIAIKMRKRMVELGITQKQLAESMGCTQQHISVLLNGRVNMTLETLAKIEDTLQLDLLSSVIAHSVPSSSPSYLNDPSEEDRIPEGFKTSALVTGYPPRKKKGPKKKEL